MYLGCNISSPTILLVCPLGDANLAQGLSVIENEAKLATPGGHKTWILVKIKFKD